MNLEKARKMRKVYKNSSKTWSQNTKGNIYRKAEPVNQKHIKRYRILCLYMEETQ